MKFPKKIRKLITLTILTLFPSFLSGCWDAREVGKLAIVAAVGIDLDEKDPGNVLVSIQIIKPGDVKSGGGDSSGGGGGGKPSGQKPILIVSSSGRTVSEAFRNFTTQIDRELYLSHNQIIVISRKAAEQGLIPLLDYFIRTRESRETTWVLVADGKAQEILETSLGMERVQALEITQLIINREMATQATGVTMHEFITQLMSKSSAQYTSLVKIIDNSGSKKLILAGTAVFKGGKLVGELDKTETSGFLWIINRIKQGIIQVNLGKSSKLDFGIRRAQSKMVPELKGKIIKIKLSIQSLFGLNGETVSEDYTKPDLTNELESKINSEIKREINAALKKAFQLKADLFGFGAVIHQKYPKEWKSLKGNWDQIFLTVSVESKIKSVIQIIGLNYKPPLPK